MAQRDYVRKKKGSSKQNHSRFISKVMMIIGIILIVLFVAILYVISKNKSEHRPTANRPEPISKPEISLPEKPQERWAYLKQLENPDNENEKEIPPQNQAIVREREQILDSFRNDTVSSTPAKPMVNNSVSIPPQQPVIQPVVTPTKPSNKIKWIIQCGAFKNKTNAESQKARIALSGIQSQIQTGSLYRVVVGSNYENKGQAEVVVSQLKNNGVNNCIISNNNK